MTTLSLKIDARSVQRMALDFSGRAHAVIERGFRQGGELVNRRMSERFRSGDASASASTASSKERDFLFRRTGQGSRSFFYEVGRNDSGAPVRLVSFSNWIAARIHEKGGEIKPKQATYLTVPLPDNLTPAGDVRYPSARALFERAEAGEGKTWIHDGVIFHSTAEQPDKILALFALKKRVTIPARLGYERTFREAAPEIRNIAAGLLAEEFGS